MSEWKPIWVWYVVAVGSVGNIFIPSSELLPIALRHASKKCIGGGRNCLSTWGRQRLSLKKLDVTLRLMIAKGLLVPHYQQLVKQLILC